MTRVLIAEDSSVIQKLIQGLLAKDPSVQVVATAGDGQAAVEAVRQHKPDFMILDYRMPKLNGPEVIKAVMSENPVPIMVLTSAEPFEEKKKECLGLGAVGFMEKPKGMDYNGIANQLITYVKTLSRLKPAKRTY